MYLQQLNIIIERAKQFYTTEELEAFLYTVVPKQGRLSKLFNRDITKKEFDEAVQKIVERYFPIVLSRYPFPRCRIKEIYSDFEMALSAYTSCKHSVVESEDVFKVYPVDVNINKRRETYESALRNLFVRSITEGVSLVQLFSTYKEKYENEVKELKERLLAKDMMPYYGSPTFMMEKAEYIRSCANKLVINAFGIDEIIENMQMFMKKYPVDKSDFGMDKFPYYGDEYKRDFEVFEQQFERVLEIEKELVPVVEERWKSFLTDPSNHDNKHFGYLVHVFSAGIVDPEVMSKACCTLATPELLTTPYGDCGLIFDFDKDHVDTICTEDAGSWMVSKQEFIERGFLTSWQLVNPQASQNVFYEYPCVSKLVLPDDLERVTIANNERYNGEILNYNKGLLYSEIFLANFPKAIGVFYTDACRDIEAVREYAKRHNLPLVNLSLKALREQRINNVEEVAEEILEEEVVEQITL